MTTRRRVLGGLSAIAAMACLPKDPGLENLPTELYLGWRLIPGQHLTYTLRSAWRVAGLTHSRTERWRYQVREVADHVALFQAHLIALAGRSMDQERTQPTTVSMRLGTDGRLRPSTPADCASVNPESTRCFGDHQAHRLLVLSLPDRPVRQGDRWDDPQQAHPFLPLLPAALDPTAQARCTIADIYRGQDGQPRVDLAVSTELRTPNGPGLSSQGVATWHPGRGVLLRRTRVVSMYGGGPSKQPGELALELTLDDPA